MFRLLNVAVDVFAEKLAFLFSSSGCIVLFVKASSILAAEVTITVAFMIA